MRPRISPLHVLLGLTLLLGGPLILPGCGPSWDDVVEYPDGTLEGPPGECFRNTPSGPIPVTCPKKKQ